MPCSKDLSKHKLIMLALLCLISSVSAHGFLMHPGPISEAVQRHAVRNYNAISNNIDSLRSPNFSGFCRGTSAQTPTTSINLVNGQPFTITMAFSIGKHLLFCCVTCF